MKAISLCRGIGVPAPVHIEVRARVPEFEDIAKAGVFYDSEAAILEDVLYSTLPGGTYDRLLARMLARKSTHFRVAHGT